MFVSPSDHKNTISQGLCDAFKKQILELNLSEQGGHFVYTMTFRDFKLK